MNDVTFEPEGHIYRLGLQVLPSVTQVIRSVFPRESTEEYRAAVDNAQERGIEVDALLSLWLNGELEEIPAGFREDSCSLFLKLSEWWNFADAEAQVILTDGALAGTADIVQPNAIYDLKTTYDIPKDAPLQLGGYCHLYEAEHGRYPDFCGVVHLTKRKAVTVKEYDVSRVVSEFRLLFDFWKLVQRYQQRKTAAR